MNLTVFLLFTLKIRQTGSECIFARRKRNIQERFVFKVDLKGSRVDQIQNCGYFVLCFHSEVVWRCFLPHYGQYILRLPVVGCCLKAVSVLQGFRRRTDETSW